MVVGWGVYLLVPSWEIQGWNTTKWMVTLFMNFLFFQGVVFFNDVYFCQFICLFIFCWGMYEVKSYTLGRMLGISFGTVAFCGFKLSTTAVAPERNTHMGVVNPVAELPGFDGVLGICLPCGLVFVNLRLQDEQHIFFIMATWHGTGSGWVGGAFAHRGWLPCPGTFLVSLIFFTESILWNLNKQLYQRIRACKKDKIWYKDLNKWLRGVWMEPLG